MITNVMERLIDFTRTSGGGYFGPDGLFRFTPASRNLLTYTQEFDNAAWVKTGAAAYPFDPAMVSLGPELVVNGDFSSGDAWTLSAITPATATIAGGKLTLVSPAAEFCSARQSIVSPGQWYRVSGSVTVRSGGVKIIVGGGPTEYTFTSTQIFSFFAPAGSANHLDLVRITPSGCDADFDNISVKEVIGGLIAAPDGTLTADALVANAGTAARSLSQSGGGSGSAQTFSIFVKAGTSNFVQLYHGSSSNIFADFNLATGVVGTVGSSATAAIESAGNGWYRCAITFTPGSASACRAAMITSATAAYAESWTATGAESLYLWGAQIELGSAATSYARNFGGLYPPRFDYDPVTKAPRGLLVEEQRTNLLLWSEEFDNASWVKGSSTVTANAAVSPDGTMDADKVIVNNAVTLGTFSAAGVRQVNSKSASAITYTYTVYMKAGEFNSGFLFMSNAATSASARASFDLSAGIASATVTVSAFTNASASMTPVGNGWYRCSLTATSDTATDLRCDVFPTDTVATQGNGTSGIYIWGAQLEAGAFATSYIPTVASQVTRTADAATVTGANFSRWYNQTSGTFLVEWRQGGSEAVQIAASVNDGTANNIMSVLNDNSSAAGVTPGAAVTNGGVAQANLTGAAITAGSTNKTALAYALNDFAYSQNGAAALTDTSGTIPTVDRLDIGNRVSALFTNGHIRRIKYYPARLSNAQIQALTA